MPIEYENTIVEISIIKKITCSRCGNEMKYAGKKGRVSPTKYYYCQKCSNERNKFECWLCEEPVTFNSLKEFVEHIKKEHSRIKLSKSLKEELNLF